jgi:hypothetical protein
MQDHGGAQRRLVDDTGRGGRRGGGVELERGIAAGDHLLACEEGGKQQEEPAEQTETAQPPERLLELGESGHISSSESAACSSRRP